MIADDGCRDAETSWLAMHLLLPDGGELYGAHADDVIRQIVAPLASECRQCGLASRFFFLRYSEAGNHVRLRLCAAIRTLVPDLRSRVLSRIAAFYPNSHIHEHETTDARRSNNTRDRSSLIASMYWSTYSPELVRYGGPAAMELAERIFESSSLTAIALLQGISEPRTRRLGKALMATLTLIQAFAPDRDEAGDLSQLCHQSYVRILCGGVDSTITSWTALCDRSAQQQRSRVLRLVDDVWCTVETGGSLTTDIDTYRGSLLRARNDLMELFRKAEVTTGGTTATSWRQCVRYLVPSYLHMMNNRLGVTVAEEAYLLRLIASGLSTAAVS
jgi:thiopeptide-type bacteriocin biosynthesis protein